MLLERNTALTEINRVVQSALIDELEYSDEMEKLQERIFAPRTVSIFSVQQSFLRGQQACRR